MTERHSGPTRRRLVRGAASLAATGAALPRRSRAQGLADPRGFPSQPIRLVVPFAPGNATDILTRQMAPAMAQALGQPVVVENRSGASGVVGSDFVAKSSPDGHTLVMGSIAPHAIAPSLMRSPPYDVLRDFTPVMLAASLPNLLVVHPSVPARNLGEFVAYAKSREGGVNYASVGSGSSSHLAGELLRARTGAPLVHVPFRDAAQAMTGLLSGQVPMLVYGVTGVLPHVREGRMRALALLSAARLPELPEFPTAAEQGMPDFVVEPWIGLFGPARLPAPVTERVFAAAHGALESPAVKAQLPAQGMQARGLPPAAFAAFLRAEIPRWAEVIRVSGATLD
ncbi:tripartite tricarboxylate transporter substrate binding protein [Roseomonas sp. NAR14]|uniref:Tripartite tricarboxylate transporter substrate binding protein n=1 Tax=Roseomonas acroporae TaxID=2937791 RepID=A0A9X1Y976_9PROT|nr:tripartite tricarboxylate transporter substrate binding protein [Roseomonas acroporae]MCK8786219.1 tripartite tricarboxylate transporter substrate binding protein [Roseomonas acroporae]